MQAVPRVRPSPSSTSSQIAAVEAPEQARVHEAHEKSSNTQHRGIARRPQFEIAYSVEEKVSNNNVERTPEHIDGCRRESLTRWLGKRALKRPPRHATDEMGNRIGEKGTRKAMARQIEPAHLRQPVFFRGGR